MVVGAAIVEIHVHASQSLKHKRGVVRSIQQRLRNQFNISVSEVGGQGTWQRAVLGMTAAGAEAPPVEKVLQRAIRFVEERHDCEVLESDLEIMVMPHEASADARDIDFPGFEPGDFDETEDGSHHSHDEDESQVDSE